MTVLTAEALQALTPVRDRLLADARRDAEQRMAQARRDTAGRLDRARQEAEQTVAEAHRSGQELAAESVARDVARARREARGIVLAAQEALRARATDAVHAAVGRLRLEPGYPALLTALAASAREALGESAVVREAPGGGVVAVAGSRRVDLSLPALADRTLHRLDREVAQLWSP
jgi:vacuolar-type H+-ATPase subunit E/Vma4